jgi:hypothetical protein
VQNGDGDRSASEELYNKVEDGEGRLGRQSEAKGSRKRELEEDVRRLSEQVRREADNGERIRLYRKR